MIYAFLVMVGLYYLIFLLYYQRLFPLHEKSLIKVALSLAAVMGGYLLAGVNEILWLDPFLLTVVMTLALRFSTAMNWPQALFGAGHCVITIYCFRGIFMALWVLVIPPRDFLPNHYAYFVFSLLAMPLSLSVLALLRKAIFPDQKLKWFLNYPNQLNLVIVYELIALVNLAIVNTGRTLAPNANWYMGVVLTTSALTFGMLIYSIYQSIRSAERMEYKWRSQMLEDQYQRQLRSYKSYQKFTESFQTFKHDYKQMMTSLKVLIKAKDNEKALTLIDDMYGEMQKKVHVHKKYSNSPVLDALLQDLANICEEQQIRYDFMASAPIHTRLSTLDAIRIFSNLANNAIEACQKVQESQRFLSVTSNCDGQWCTLEAINSYDGNVVVNNGKFSTLKPNKGEHGLGLTIVTTIVESVGGFIVYDANPDTKIFRVRVHVPQVEPH